MFIPHSFTSFTIRCHSPVIHLIFKIFSFPSHWPHCKYILLTSHSLHSRYIFIHQSFTSFSISSTSHSSHSQYIFIPQSFTSHSSHSQYIFISQSFTQFSLYFHSLVIHLILNIFLFSIHSPNSLYIFIP